MHQRTVAARHRHDQIIRERGDEIRVALVDSSIKDVARSLGVPLTVVRQVKGRARYSRVAQRPVKGLDYADEELIEALRRAATNGRLSQVQYERRRRPTDPARETFKLRYGSWNAAIAAADLHPAEQSGGNRRRWSDDDIRMALVRCGKWLGRAPSYHDYEEWAKTVVGAPSAGTIRYYKGRWLEALDDAGF